MMKNIALLKNRIQKYAWGSKTAIPELLGKSPDGDPQAELWMGAHPAGPSEVNVDGRWVSLQDLIDADPESILGNRASRRFNRQLPFLFKVLAAGRPLSIQAHPDALQAEEGFERETAAGIPIGSGTRNYRDRNHKPECICAITPFWALNGFRTIQAILFHLERLCPKGLGTEIGWLKKNPKNQTLKSFFECILTKPEASVDRIVKEACDRAGAIENEGDPVSSWIIRLYEAYPRDIGVLAPALLNLVLLNPGEAMYLSAGRLHAYLEGVGMELMANSDNVLRGGLTPKHVDVPELLKVLKFEETIPAILKPVPRKTGIRQYVTPAEEFVLSEITVDGFMPFENRRDAGVEILFCREGEVRATDDIISGKLDVRKGMSLIVPASVERYSLEGDAVLYRATMGDVLEV